jgi:hypothetical protein
MTFLQDQCKCIDTTCLFSIGINRSHGCTATTTKRQSLTFQKLDELSELGDIEV